MKNILSAIIRRFKRKVYRAITLDNVYECLHTSNIELLEGVDKDLKDLKMLTLQGNIFSFTK